MLGISSNHVRLDVLLTACLTSSAAMPPVCMHGTDVLTLFLSLPSPWKPLQVQTVTASRFSTAGRTTAGECNVVALGTLTRSSAAQSTRQTTDTITGTTQWQAWDLAGSGGDDDGRCRASGRRVCRLQHKVVGMQVIRSSVRSSLTEEEGQ